jgi:hypothetical protein
MLFRQMGENFNSLNSLQRTPAAIPLLSLITSAFKKQPPQANN